MAQSVQAAMASLQERKIKIEIVRRAEKTRLKMGVFREGDKKQNAALGHVHIYAHKTCLVTTG